MELFVDKNTDLMRSTFIAVGLADLLNNIPPSGSNQQVMLIDLGSAYQLQSKVSARELTEYVESRGLPPLLDAIYKPLTPNERRLAEGGTSLDDLRLKYVPRGYAGEQVDYEAEKDKFEQARKSRTKKKGQREEGEVIPPAKAFPVWAHLCSYFGKGSAMRSGYPSMIHTWHAHQGEAAIGLWQMISNVYSAFPNAVEIAREDWHQNFLSHLDYQDYALSTNVSALAVVSPSTSKGVSDPTGYNTLNEGTLNEFWLEMYFAFAGFMRIAMPFNLGSDVTTFYPLPRQITFDDLIDHVQNYRADADTRSLYMFSNNLSRVKLDVLATIDFYRSMVKALASSVEKEARGRADLKAISGFVGFYYKNISTQIPFDETIFSRPAWLPPEANVDQLKQAKRVLDEHREIIARIRGRAPKYQLTGSELTLFDSYRRYLALGNPEDWIEFAIAYELYRFRNMPDQPGLQHLTLSTFKESFPMTHTSADRMDFRPIMDAEKHPGFHNIAAAINSCTVYARYKNDVQKDKSFGFKTRHGLGNDLLRNAHNPEQFIADLSRFIHDYQQESANVRVDTGKSRQAIQPEDMSDITDLIAEYGSKVVAHMLVAAGYASRFPDRSTD